MQGFFITAKEMKPIGKLPNILRQAHQAIADVADNADSWRALSGVAYPTFHRYLASKSRIFPNAVRGGAIKIK